ncbi:glycosyltransferase family 87 protein [Breoghania sp. JC706]|uniref:glycosyltransferase family 87 protein n=1 Tax=Breoghania sp. JC706 TaxID=3117732 RepID=UPI00300987EC
MRAIGAGGEIRRENVERAAVILIAAYASLFGYFVYVALATGDPGKAVGMDFVSFWTAARSALTGNPTLPYDLVAFSQRQMEIFGISGVAFFYPPSWLLYLLPFGLVPFGLGYALFEALTLILACLAMRCLVRRREALWISLAFPGFLFCLLHGQNGLLSAALFGFAMAALERRLSWLAGFAIGLLAYKPHFGLLVPFALLAGREYRAFAAAAVTTVAVAAASWLAFGTATWQAFLAQIPLAGANLVEAGISMARMISLFAWLRQAGVGANAAMAAQLLLSVAVFAAVMLAWRRAPSMPLKAAILVSGATLVVPFILDYDMALLAIPAGLLIRLGLEEGFGIYEKSALAACFALMFLSGGLGIVVPFGSGPLPGLMLFALAGRRILVAAPFRSSDKAAAAT